jgi:3-deoxy-manno-octulosonate cytidylyltransferase (CMP-KDO synthetase)
MKRVLGIIPARYASTRFPGKPLVDIQGKPMIQWVYERCSDTFDHLLVATDDYRIINAVHAFGGEASLTAESHKSGTDRCLEAYEIVKKEREEEFDIIVNIQGDEPLVNPDQLRELIACFDIEGTEIATLIHPLANTEDPDNPDIVKVVVDNAYKSLYFSRSPIPFKRDINAKAKYYKHIGLYAYTPGVLKQVCALNPSGLEISESLEQLRWLENGFEIQTNLTKYESAGVDSPADLERVRTLLRST